MWVQFGAAAFGFAIVVAFLAVAVFRSRRKRPADPLADTGGVSWVVLGGIVLPIVVLTGLFVFSARNLSALTKPPKASAVEVQITGHRWWWEVRYPEQRVVTANQVVVPVGQDVLFRITSDDVIHSFWAPQLQRKMDAIPGTVTSTWWHVTKPGLYRGVCSEFCGLEHGRMQFMVQALPEGEFRAWLAGATLPARKPTTPSEKRGEEVFTTSTCAVCHTIRGTPAGGDFAPDLTHIAIRPAIAGAQLPTNRGNLGGWIMDPQHVKPGALMPPGKLTGPELQSLLDYLESLR